MELSEIREQSCEGGRAGLRGGQAARSATCLWSAARQVRSCGEKIGTHSSVEVAEAVFEGIHSVTA